MESKDEKLTQNHRRYNEWSRHGSCVSERKISRAVVGYGVYVGRCGGQGAGI